MTPRRAATPDDAPSLVRPSVRVGTAAARLELSTRQIWRLLASGELQAHRIGKRGLRIFVDSIEALQAGNPVAPAPPPAGARRQPSRSAKHREALAYLDSLGLL